jgi:uncharacterized damage-inducible protein DinB
MTGVCLDKPYLSSRMIALNFASAPFIKPSGKSKVFKSRCGESILELSAESPIAGTRTRDGLRVKAMLDKGAYKNGERNEFTLISFATLAGCSKALMNIVEMFQYSSAVRAKFATRLAELPKEMVEKNREASFYSMKNILLHMIDNEDWIVNYALFEKTKEYKRRKWEEYPDMESVLQHLHVVEGKTREYLDHATEGDFKRKIKFELPSGKIFENLSVEECLFQSFTEQLYHIGELIALMWQENLEPPTMQWFYNNPRVATTAMQGLKRSGPPGSMLT